MRTYVFEKFGGSGKTIPLYGRLLLVLLVISIQMLYIPTSNRVTGGIEPKLPIDIFPILPVWVLPYLLCIPLWLVGVLWATFKMDDHFFRAFIAAFFLTSLASVAIFVFVPTYVRAVSFPGKDIFASILQSIHQDTGRYDAFPSGHVYITTLLAIFYSRWYPHRKWLWISIVVIVVLSTLFTGQHYLMDVIGGLVIAFFGHNLGCLWAGFPVKKVSTSR